MQVDWTALLTLGPNNAEAAMAHAINQATAKVHQMRLQQFSAAGHDKALLSAAFVLAQYAQLSGGD
jgi:hypothetical protein